MQRTGQARKGTSAALSMWTLITGDKGLLGLGWPALGSRACPHHGHRPQHIPCVDCFLSLNPPCPGQDSDDSWVLHLSRSLWYFWGFQHVHHAHMFLGAGLHGVQTVAKDRAGQVGHACVLRIAERCGNMYLSRALSVTTKETQPKWQSRNFLTPGTTTLSIMSFYYKMRVTLQTVFILLLHYLLNLSLNWVPSWRAIY